MNSSILIATILMTTLSISVLQQSYATGGSEVIELVLPWIDETKQAVLNNDTDTALNKLEEIKIELRDTFFADDALEEKEQEENEN